MKKLFSALAAAATRLDSRDGCILAGLVIAGAGISVVSLPAAAVFVGCFLLFIGVRSL